MIIPSTNSLLKCYLKDYKLESISFRVEKDGAIRLSEGDDDILDINTNLSVHKDNPNRYIVFLNVDYTKRLNSTSETVFRMQCSMYGFFESQNAFDEQMKAGEKYLLWVNGATILYGLLRATVASISAQCFAGRILLRTVMMTDVVNDAVERCKSSVLSQAPSAEQTTQTQFPPADDRKNPL